MLNVFDVDYLVLKKHFLLSHISATVGDSQRFYIAAQVFINFHVLWILNPYFDISIDMIYHQGPMANTVHNFWAMVQVALSFLNIVF